MTRCRPRDAVLPWPQAELSAIGRSFNAALRWRLARGLRPWTVLPVGGLGLRERRFDLGPPDGGGRFRAVGDSLAKGEPVSIAGFGTFTTKSRPARQGRNPPHRRGHRYRGVHGARIQARQGRFATPSTLGLPDRPAGDCYTGPAIYPRKPRSPAAHAEQWRVFAPTGLNHAVCQAATP